VNSALAFSAAFACALCNAGAAILQKVSSDKVTTIKSYNAGVVVRLFRQVPYVLGLVLDLLAGIFTLIAAHTLPLFVVQAIIAGCVVITAWFEQVFLHRRLTKQIYLAAVVVLIGLGCLAAASHAERTAVAGAGFLRALAVAPVVLVAIGALGIKFRGRLSAVVLAVLSGAAFGCVSIIGRLLVYPDPVWLVFKNPLIWALVVYGGVGMFLFTAALQRSLATIVNGIMTSAQTIIPILIGIMLLGDTARHGLWPLVWIGCVLVVGGCAQIAFAG